MKAILVMFDSLNRHLLQSYGCDWTRTPNFLRLARQTTQFENAYVGSMPCMPGAAHRPPQLSAPELGPAGTL